MAFDLGELLKDVSNSDAREQIEYIKLELIDGDEQNFYELSDVDALANNIATIGLQQPLRVRPHPAAEGRYMVVSGHRRRAALQMLAQDEPERWDEVACIVDRDAVSPALQQLRLIFGNANTRKMSSADLNEQAAQVEKLLYQLKEDGYEFPGRMRDHVAQVVQTSKTKLAKLKVIRENLAPCWQGRYKRNKLVEETAYSLAQLPAEWQTSIFDVLGENAWFNAANVKGYMKRFQEIDKLKCKKRGRECSCQNAVLKRENAVKIPSYSAFYCGKCCGSCPDLVSCKNACPVFATKVKQMKADNRAARQQEKFAQEEKDRPQVEQVKALWARFGYERERAKKSVKEVFKAQDRYYCESDEQRFKEHEDGIAKITPGTKLPYNYNCYLPEINRLIIIADLFGCSLDYLLCRTDVREMAQETPAEKVPEHDTDATEIVPGNWYPTSVEPPMNAEIIMVDECGYASNDKYLGAGMLKDATTLNWEDAVLWTLAPSKATAANLPDAPAENTQQRNAVWQVGKPTIPGDYILLIRYNKRAPMWTELWEWDGDRWVDETSVFDPDVDGDIMGWIPMPGGVKESNAYFDSQCVTGLNPYGHCGSAACCTEPYTCCKDCPDPCNSRCGYLED